jgi:hypothetical protein
MGPVSFSLLGPLLVTGGKRLSVELGITYFGEFRQALDEPANSAP